MRYTFIFFRKIEKKILTIFAILSLLTSQSGTHSFDTADVWFPQSDIRNAATEPRLSHTVHCDNYFKSIISGKTQSKRCATVMTEFERRKHLTEYYLGNSWLFTVIS